MKIKKSQLIETFQKMGMSENIISKIFNKVLSRNKVKKLDKEISNLEDEILDLLKDTPELSDEERSALERELGIN
jgi:hypothetical protein